MERERSLFLVRHGQTTSNLIKALDTALPGADLTDLGQQQAQAAGAALRQRTTAARIASSQALRAQHTARLLREAFVDQGGVATNGGARPGMAEIPAGDLEMRTDHEAHVAYHTAFGLWLSHDLNVRVPGGNDGHEILEQYLPSLFELALEEAERDLVVVSHGAVIRFVAGYLGKVPPEFAFQHYLANCEWVEISLPEPQRLAELASGSIEAMRGTLNIREWGTAGAP